MKKLITVILLVIALGATLTITGCDEASRVSENLSTEADNFNVVRQITVIDCITGDILFQMTGKISLEADTTDNQLEITVEDENGDYQKHFIGLSDNVTYVVEQLTGVEVDKYQYTINYNPKMWLPVQFENVD